VRWEEFASSCPELARLAEERFRKDELIILGTLRAYGWPRLNPVELDFAAGQLLIGMMWRSLKALDLLRDSRCALHSVPSDRMNPGGDVKLYAHAVDVHDAELRSAYRDAIRARIDWAPDEPDYHLFAIDVESAGYVRFDERSMERWRWTPGAGLSKDARPNA
jgi:hypothetical protein